jgi:hypothetical protein
MKLNKTLAIVSLGTALLSGASNAKAASQVFTHVNVISMSPDGPRLLRRQTVVVEDGSIVAIGKAKQVETPADAEVIRAKGDYLLPGLYDMHAHGDDVRALPEGVSPEELYTLYFANGITGLFDPWGFDQLFTWRNNIERGKVVGPRLYFSSPGVNDDTHATAADVERDVRRWAAQGYERIKTHSRSAATSSSVCTR